MSTGAEAVAVGAASRCLKCCCNQFDQYIVEAGKNVSDLQSEVSKLRAMGGDVNNTVATRRQGKSKEVVENWLDRSAAIEEEAKKVSEDYAAMCLPHLNCWTRYRIGKRAFRKLQKTKDLIDERESLEEALTSTTPTKHELQEKQIETLLVGMDPYLERALLYIDKDEVGVIGICGMGGVGKTTLLRKIHGEFLPGKEKSKDFNKVVWAIVFKNDALHNDIARLQNDIAKQLGLNLADSNMLDDNCSKEVLEQRALPIYEYLSTRNFLLLLDDLWSPLDLKSIGVPDPTSSGANSQTKRKVVLTSRSKTICGQMQAAPGLIDVQCLDDEDAWLLFKFNATEQTIASHTAISGLAWDVMRECQGLPLALNTIGKALSTKSGDPKPWREAFNKLKNARHSEIPGMEQENAAMLHRIKISYDYLPSQSAKNCFLSCCLWPEDCSIEKAKLVECWLGLGLIPSSSAIDDDIDNGFGIITSLKEAHLLESGNDEATEVRMHDVLRAMSLWISSECGRTRNKWIVKASTGIKTKQRLAEQWQECSPDDTEWVSLMNNLIEELPSVVPKIDRLQVLMLQWNPSLRVIPGPFLLSAPMLTYLDLSNTIIEELPLEVGLLHHLQYLNLSESYIRKLPKELSCLTRLRHLLMNATLQLEIIPYGIISKLVQLQMLDIFQSKYASWGADMMTNTAVAGASEDDNDLYACLREFEARETFLKWLGITLDSIDALQRLARCNTVSTRWLCFRRMPSPPSLHLLPSRLSELLGGLDMLESLEVFMAMSCESLEQVIIDGGSDRDKYRGGYCLPKLQKLELLSLPRLEHIRFQGMPAKEFLPRLRSLTIAACSKLKNVSWVLYLPQLLHLELQFCPSMEKLIDATERPTNDIEQENLTFPLLKTLIIYTLKSLTSLCSGRSVHFPELQVVEIIQCSNLTELNIRPQGKLREIRGGEEWWQGLRWEEPSVREQLQPYFQYHGQAR